LAIKDRRSLRRQLDGEADLIRKYEAMCAQAEDAICKTHREHFGQPVEVRFYRTMTIKRGKRKAE
jgi:hypothetical protein